MKDIIKYTIKVVITTLFFVILAVLFYRSCENRISSFINRKISVDTLYLKTQEPEQPKPTIINKFYYSFNNPVTVIVDSGPYSSHDEYDSLPENSQQPANIKYLAYKNGIMTAVTWIPIGADSGMKMQYNFNTKRIRSAGFQLYSNGDGSVSFIEKKGIYHYNEVGIESYASFASIGTTPYIARTYVYDNKIYLRAKLNPFVYDIMDKQVVFNPGIGIDVGFTW